MGVCFTKKKDESIKKIKSLTKEENELNNQKLMNKEPSEQSKEKRDTITVRFSYSKANYDYIRGRTLEEILDNVVQENINEEEHEPLFNLS